MQGTTPYLRDLLQHANNILDSGYVAEVESGPAWDRRDQLLQVGSVVQLLNNKVVVKGLQKNVGKWVDGLDNVIGPTALALVRGIDLDGVLALDFSYFGSPQTKLRFVNPKAVDRLSQGRSILCVLTDIGTESIPMKLRVYKHNQQIP